jgi:hypothetical protein
MFGYLYQHHIIFSDKKIKLYFLLYTSHILKYFFYICSDNFIIILYFSPPTKNIIINYIHILNIFLNIFFINVWISLLSLSYNFAGRKNTIIECCYILNIFLNIFFINVWISSSLMIYFPPKKISSSNIAIYLPRFHEIGNTYS